MNQLDALYDAAIAGDVDAIAKLEMEADKLDHDEKTILHIQSQNGNTERVRFILSKFAHKNLLVKLNYDEETALHLAIYARHTEVVEVIIEEARRHLSETSFQAFLRQGDIYGNTALHLAVMKRSVEIVKLLVEADPTDTHIQNNEDKTPMYIAVEEEYNEIVEIIFTTCTAPSLDGPDDQTILHIESQNGNTERVRFILREFANKNLSAKLTAGTVTALHLAIESGHTEVAEVIIEAARRHLPETSFQAFLRQGDQDKDTALHLAVMKRNVAIAKLLVEADPTDTHVQNYEGESPMYIAVERGYNDLVELISTTCTAPSLDGPYLSTVVRVNNLDQVKSPGGTLYKIMDTDVLYAAAIAGDADAIAKFETEADIFNNGVKTILHIESRNGNTERVRFILREFANKNLLAKSTKIYKHTALHLAIYGGQTDVAKVLIEAARHLASSSTNDDPINSFQAFLRQGDKDMDTALHAAVLEGNIEIVKLLVEADPTGAHSKNNEGKTPIYVAAEKGHKDIEIVKLLVEADPTGTHSKNNEGKTPVYVAAEKGHKDIVKVICSTCIAISDLDGPGGTSTALHAAVKNWNHDIEVVEVLIATARLLSSASDNDNTGSNPSSSFQDFLRRVDEHLNSALHIAVMQGKLALATAKLLVQADPTYPGIQNNNGQTPFFIAAERGYADILKMMCAAAPINLDGRGGRLTALHAVVRNLDEEKNEVRDVIKMYIDVYKGALISKKKNLDEFKIHKIFADEIFSQTDEYGQTILELAVERNYVEVVELILDVRNPAHRDEWIGDDFINLMPLIYKAKNLEYNDTVKVLSRRYEAGAKLSIDLKTQASLIFAIRRREEELVSSLLDNHAKDLVTFADNLGWTSLHHATYNGFNSIINRIIEEQKRFGHSFGYKNMVSTPFHVAAEKGYLSTLILLMQLWPSWSSTYTAADKNGQNILHLAALQSKKEMIQGILKNCPETHKIKFVNKQDNDGNTPLHLLIENGCFVPELFRYEGLDTTTRNQNRKTPLDMLYTDHQGPITNDQVKIGIALGHIQIDQQRDSLSSSVLSLGLRERKDKLLITKAKEMINEKHAEMKENTGAVAKCYADAIAGDPISRAALEMEADTRNEAGETILHVESKKGVTENVRFIVSAFANKNLLVKLDNQKQTALYLAAHNGHTQVVEVLVDAARHLPSSSSANDYNHITPIQAYIRQDTGPKRNTALHLAVLNCEVAIVKLLLQADPNDSHVPNNEGKTPIYIAAEKGYKDIVKEICTTCTVVSLDGPGGRTTALHALIQNIGQEGASDVFRMMVSTAKRWSSADFEALFRRTDELGNTVLQLAVEKDCVDSVSLILLEDPAYQPGREIKRNGLMHLIFKAMDRKCSDDLVQLLSQTYQAGISPDHTNVLELILAIRRRDEDSVLSLLKGGKHLVTFTEDNGWTPLHYAVYHEFDSVLGAIIEAQENVGYQFVYENMVPTPFHVAVEYGYASTLVRVMQSWPALSSASTADNSPYTVVNKDGRNILHLAAADNSNIKADNRKEMVEGILKYCPELYKEKILKQQDTNGDTPLHLLISQGCFIPELINDERLDKMAKNKSNLTPWEMLYYKNDVVADQVEIKIAIDDIQTSRSSWNFWAKSTKKKEDIWKSIPTSKRRIKDVIFDERKKSLMHARHENKKEKLEKYKMRTNTQIIVTALITTVTFTVGFTMPGGLHQSGEVDEGLVLLSKKTAFNAFMVSDALALLLSTSSLFFYFLQSMNDDPRQVSILNDASTVLNIVSVMAMMLTFIAGTYLVLSHSPGLAFTVCIIGSLFFLLIIILLIKIVYDRLQGKRNLD